MKWTKFLLLTFVCTTTLTVAKPQEGSFENTYLNWGGYEDNVAREDTYGKQQIFFLCFLKYAGFFSMKL